MNIYTDLRLSPPIRKWWFSQQKQNKITANSSRMSHVADTLLFLPLHHYTFLSALKHAWLHILQYEVLLHRGDWSSWQSHDMDLTQARDSSSSSSLGKPEGCWRSTPDHQAPTEKDLQSPSYIRRTVKRLREAQSRCYMITHAKDRRAGKSALLTAYLWPPDWRHSPANTHTDSCFSDSYGFQQDLCASRRFIELVWRD